MIGPDFGNYHCNKCDTPPLNAHAEVTSDIYAL